MRCSASYHQRILVKEQPTFLSPADFLSGQLGGGQWETEHDVSGTMKDVLCLWGGA